ncbi:MAG: YjbE family putative metal transport protein [Alphaproteobacteria bacterium]|nr:YjbE family putative metal transport protein [Alphaproteobacteria bacterium]
MAEFLANHLWFEVTPETVSAISALISLILADLILAGDNALIIGMVASQLPQHLRKKALVWGMGIAIVARILFSLVAVYLLRIPGLQIVGGLLLLWIAWQLYRNLKRAETKGPKAREQKTHWYSRFIKSKNAVLTTAIVEIGIADISLSLDNVLVVAGAAIDHPYIMVVGLVLSIALLGAAATVIARLMAKYKWLGLVGVVLIAIIGLQILWHGVGSVEKYFGLA